MNGTVAGDLLATFLTRVETHDADAAVAVVGEAVAAGLTTEEIIISVLAPAQLEVGARWQTRRWAVADEHAATAICESALSAAAPHDRRASTTGTIALGCVEEEWHALPARMFAELLGCRGHRVVFLGAALASDHLNVFLRDLDPVALVISCSVSMNLPGAGRVIDAAHAVGCPVLAGGSGFGTTPLRANALGADGWASTLDDASAILRAWEQERPQPHAVVRARSGEHLDLAVDRHSIVTDAMAQLAERFPPMSGYDARQLSHTRADLGYIVRFLEAAVLTGDDSIFLDFLAWLAGVLRAANVPDAALDLSLACLAAVLPDTHHEARRLLGTT
jgi:methanogenic corrinoid protein MtbC1